MTDVLKAIIRDKIDAVKALKATPESREFSARIADMPATRGFAAALKKLLPKAMA